MRACVRVHAIAGQSRAGTHTHTHTDSLPCAALIRSLCALNCSGIRGSCRLNEAEERSPLKCVAELINSGTFCNLLLSRHVFVCVSDCSDTFSLFIFFFINFQKKKKNQIDKKYFQSVLRNVLNWVVIVAWRRARRNQLALLCVCVCECV